MISELGSRQLSKMHSDVVSITKDNNQAKVSFKSESNVPANSMKSTADNSKSKPIDTFLKQPATLN